MLRPEKLPPARAPDNWIMMIEAAGKWVPAAATAARRRLILSLRRDYN